MSAERLSVYKGMVEKMSANILRDLSSIIDDIRTQKMDLMDYSEMSNLGQQLYNIGAYANGCAVKLEREATGRQVSLSSD